MGSKLHPLKEGVSYSIFSSGAQKTAKQHQKEQMSSRTETELKLPKISPVKTLLPTQQKQSNVS